MSKTSSEVRIMKFINVIEVIKLGVYSSLNDRYLVDSIYHKVCFKELYTVSGLHVNGLNIYKM